MILFVPHLDTIDPVDQRLIRLGELLGIECRQIVLSEESRSWDQYFKGAAPDGDSCLVFNSGVFQKWVGEDILPEDLSSHLLAHFRHLLVHGFSGSPFDSSVLQRLSHGTLLAVGGIQSENDRYSISEDLREICGAFAGLEFGPANPINDRIFLRGQQATGLQNLISIAGCPFMAVHEWGNCKAWFIAGKEVVDLDAKVGSDPLSSYFSRLLPHAMALRSVFGDESWSPGEMHGAVIIDDPLLRRDYGALNFETLLELMKHHNFHSTLAFIPHNFKRSSARTVCLLRENSTHFSLCFHGNDHTSAEFASKDTKLLETLLNIAQQRMQIHQRLTGLLCDRIMVFPQGKFSVEAMAALGSQNFDAAVNTTPHPLHEPNDLTLAEIVQPAVLRYADFPLFLRKSCLNTKCEDVAFNSFFGKPTLIVEHHDIFRRPEILVEAVNRINNVVPNMHWSNLGMALKNAVLRKRTRDGINHIRGYSRTVQLSNNTQSDARYSVEWLAHSADANSARKVFLDGSPVLDFVADHGRIQLSIDLPARDSRSVCLRQNTYSDSAAGNLGFRYNTRAFVRRRLTEIRDNHLSKYPRVLAIAKSVRGI